jgi:hypothetical protein
MVVYMKNTILWDMTPCSLVKVYRRFSGACCLRLDGRRVDKASSTEEECGKHGVECQ